MGVDITAISKAVAEVTYIRITGGDQYNLRDAIAILEQNGMKECERCAEFVEKSTIGRSEYWRRVGDDAGSLCQDCILDIGPAENDNRTYQSQGEMT